MKRPLPPIALFLALALGVSAGEMRLAVRGAAPEYTIVIPAAMPSSVHTSAASPSLDYAAAELADFFERQTGVRLRIQLDSFGPLPEKAILLGGTRYTDALLNEQVQSSEFKVQSSAGEPPAPLGGAASGRARRDAAPPITSQDSKTPELQEAKATTVKLSNCQTNYSEAVRALGPDGFRLVARPPHLLIVGSAERGALYGVYELLERFGGCRWYSSWCSKIPSLDAFAVPDDLDDAQRPAFDLRSPAFYDILMHPAFSARLRVNDRFWRWDLEPRFGGNPYRWGKGLGGHTFGTLLRADQYYDAHPEYFSLVKGKRLKGTQGQLCLTNPDVAVIVASNLLGRIRRDPGAKFYSVSQNDNLNRCQCTNCLAVEAEEESPSGPVIRFVNAVADIVGEEFPDVLVHTFAYNYSKKPPARTKPRPNVMIQLCTDGAEHALPMRGNTDKGTAAVLGYIEGWSRLTDNVFIWDYLTDFRHYTLPWPCFLSLQDNFRLLRGNGIRLYMGQGNNIGSHGDFAELKAWLLAKWLWNPDLPMEPLLDDFFNGYFGAAAPYARRSFDLAHEKVSATAADGRRLCVLPMYGSSGPAVLDADFLSEAAELWRKAEEAVKDDPGALYNVRMASFPVDELRFERAYKSVDFTDAAQRNDAVARETAATLLAKFREAGDMRISEFQHNGDFTRRWQDAVRRAPMTNGAVRAEVEDKAFDTWGGAARRVDDPGADDGRAIRVVPPCDGWIVRFPMKRAAFKPDMKYRVRVRLRADIKDDKADGNVFRAGIEPGQGGSLTRTTVKASDLSEGYAWYEVAVWRPRGGDFLWMGPAGSATIYIDKIDFAPVVR